MTDPNGNRAEVAFDRLGLVAGTAVMGKITETKGDSLTGFVPNLTQQQRQDFLADPLGNMALLLGQATTRIVYDLDRLSREAEHQTIIMEDLAYNGVKVECVLREIDDTPEGRLMLSILGYTATVERERTRERTMRGRKARAQRDKRLLGQGREKYGLKFIEDHRAGQPFFLLLALSAPHLPLNPNPEHAGHSQAAAYGDVVEEIDAQTGRLVARLKALGIDRDTILIVTSDNGPWFEGSAGGLRDRKGGAGWDGGYRVPFIAWGPGRIPEAG